MTERTFIEQVWVIATSEASALKMVKHTPKVAYRDHTKASQDFQRVREKTTVNQWSRGDRWKLYKLTFALTFAEEES